MERDTRVHTAHFTVLPRVFVAIFYIQNTLSEFHSRILLLFLSSVSSALFGQNTGPEPKHPACRSLQDQYEQYETTVAVKRQRIRPEVVRYDGLELNGGGAWRGRRLPS